jgi:serine phosphatase RsbU (regulator of sigma subunit)
MAPPDGSGHRELFGVERLDEVLCASGGASAESCVERVCVAVERFTGGGTASDDRTLVAIRVLS